MSCSGTPRDSRRLFEQFVIAGLDEDNLEPLSPASHECGLRNTQQLAPITDITVIFTSLGETVPEGFEMLSKTTLGYPADLNHGSIRMPNVFICFRRGYHKPPLVDIGVLDKGKGEKPLVDSNTILATPFGRPANVNNASQALHLTYRRAPPDSPPSLLVVTHLCVILANKGEIPPHTYYKIPINLNQGIVGSDVYLCYKKSQGTAKRIAYKPAVLDCFPRDRPLWVSNVPMFCLPMGAFIECWTARSQQPDKSFSTFVLTDENGTKFYGAAVTFYEEYRGQLTEEQLETFEVGRDNEEEAGAVDDSSSTNDPTEQLRFYKNASICIVSRFPFFTAFKRFLFHLHRMTTDPKAKHVIPIERFISHLMFEVSFPSPRRPRVLMHLGSSETILFESYDDSQLPLSGAHLFETLKCLGTETLMYLVLLALLEQKILIHSLRPHLLTTVSESLVALMFPFHWQCPYVPQCPLSLAGIMQAPCPFIAGVDSRYFELYEDPPDTVTSFDLDTGTISASAVRGSTKLSMLPKKAVKQLRNTLDSIRAEPVAVLKRLSAEDFRVSKQHNADLVPVEADLNIHKKRKMIESSIHDAFLRLMAHLMRGYQAFLRPITSRPRFDNDMDVSKLFDKDGFLRSRDKASAEFFKRFSETQLFSRFIEDRCFISDKNAFHAFFDDCIAKVVGVESGVDPLAPLLDSGESSSSDHTIFIPSPDAIIDPQTGEERRFEYTSGFPRVLDESFFQLDKLALDAKREPSDLSFQNDASRCVCLRTKPEVRSSLMAARSSVRSNPINWAKTLLFHSYSLWFLLLPSQLKLAPNKKKTLRLAFHVLSRMEWTEIFPLDQICFRILISLCGESGEAALAVRVLNAMRRAGLDQNAVTYGVYHRAVMNAKWPSTAQEAASFHWRRIANAIGAVARLRALFRDTHGRYPSQAGEADEEILSIPVPASKTLPHKETGNNGYNEAPHREVPTEVDGAVDGEPKTEGASVDCIADPLGATLSAENENEAQSNEGREESAREKFLAQHSVAPFSQQPAEEAEEKKSGGGGASGWLKGLTNSPLLKIIKSHTFDEKHGRKDSLSDGGTSSAASLNVSPSLHSFVGNIKRGYDNVIKDTVRQGMSSLVHGLNRSYGPSRSGSNVGDYEDDLRDVVVEEQDPAYQLDGGRTGAISRQELWWPEGTTHPQPEAVEGETGSALVMLEVSLSTCTRCPSCHSIVYDEDIMAAWKVDDQNLLAECFVCGLDEGAGGTPSRRERGSFLPDLRVRTRWIPAEGRRSWYRVIHKKKREDTAEEAELSEADRELLSRPVEEKCFRLLSPLVLRKELESLLATDLHAFTDSSLVTSRNCTIYWNLVLYMRRLGLPSHLFDWLGPNTLIRCVFDRPDLHSDIVPLYFANPDNTFVDPAKAALRSRKVWEDVISCISQNQLFNAIKLMCNEHRRVTDSGIVLARHPPMFRDLQFTALDKFGHSLMRDHLDSLYREEMCKLPPRIYQVMPKQDHPQRPSQRACRKVFLPLDLF